MCIAILNAKGVLSLKTFKTCWAANPDGAGLCYFDGEKIQIVKEMKSVKAFHQSYLDVRAMYPEIDIAIHFRISTHGRVNVTNCHPFKVNKTTGFIHNGVINNVSVSTDFSDTYIFNETIMKALPSDFIKNMALLDLLSVYIGYSKLVIISGKISTIVNEELGVWDAGNWYSNKSYLQPKQPTAIKAPVISKTIYGWDYWDGYSETEKAKNKDVAKDEGYIYDTYCECCREISENITYVNEWSMDICDKCLEEFKPEGVS
jgi:hypothetical protein